jgi:hypothetical protein
MLMLAWLLSALLARKSENRFRSLVIAGLVLFGWPVMSRWALDKWRNYGKLVPASSSGWVSDSSGVAAPTTSGSWLEVNGGGFAVPDPRFCPYYSKTGVCLKSENR